MLIDFIISNFLSLSFFITFNDAMSDRSKKSRLLQKVKITKSFQL